MLNQTEPLKAANTTAAAVAAWISAHEQEFAHRGDTTPVRIDGANVLGALFPALTDQKEQYNKVFHGVRLTKWLLEHRPEALSEVADLLRRMLGPIDGAAWPTTSAPE